MMPSNSAIRSMSRQLLPVDRPDLRQVRDGWTALAMDIINMAANDYRVMMWRRYCWEHIEQDMLASDEYKRLTESEKKVEEQNKLLNSIDFQIRSMIEQARDEYAMFKKSYPYSPLYAVDSGDPVRMGLRNIAECRALRRSANEKWSKLIDAERRRYEAELQKMKDLQIVLMSPALARTRLDINHIRYKKSKNEALIREKQEFFCSPEFDILSQAEINGRWIMGELDKEIDGIVQMKTEQRVKAGKHPYDFRRDAKRDDDAVEDLS